LKNQKKKKIVPGRMGKKLYMQRSKLGILIVGEMTDGKPSEHPESTSTNADEYSETHG